MTQQTYLNKTARSLAINMAAKQRNQQTNLNYRYKHNLTFNVHSTIVLPNNTVSLQEWNKSCLNNKIAMYEKTTFFTSLLQKKQSEKS